MSMRMFKAVGLSVLGCTLLWQPAAEAAGLLTPSDGRFPALEIKEHHVNVVIDDGYAITSVEQIFHNPNGQDLEAIYSFPIPEKAAVGEFTYWIDGQPVIGEVLEKKQAKQLYEQEKQAGREAALTEQDSYKTFDINVYPVRAQQDVRIKLAYIQPVHVDTSIGRYVYPLEEGGVDEEKLSFWTYNDEVKEQFSFNLSFRSSYPVDQFRLPQHSQAGITQIDANQWQVSLANNPVVAEEGEANAAQPAQLQRLDKDIVVYWRHQQGLPGSVDMISYREPGQSRGTFMLTLTPGDDLNVISEGRDWVFVLDLSGSMAGKYQSLVEGVNKGLSKLNPNDRYRVVLFNNSAQEITQGYEAASAENVRQTIARLEAIETGGGTNLYGGLKLGLQALDADRSSAVILVTDGVANVGTTEKKQFLKLLQGHDVRLFTFVMGNSANRPLLEGMAKVSNGFAMSISNSDDIAGKILEAQSKLTHAAMHDVDLKISGVKVKELTPAHIGSLYRGQQLIVFGHYWGEGEATLQLNTKIAGQEKRYQTQFNFPEQSVLNPEIERLWAFAKIEDLSNQMDYLGADSDTEQAITDLAVEHGLVTEYTSMLVMRDEQFEQQGIDRTNKQRVEKEQAAREQRAQQPVRNNRVDQAQPTFSTPRPSYGGGGGGGGGAMPLWLVLTLPLLIWVRKRRGA